MDFGEVDIEGLLLLDLVHVEVGLAEVLGGLELLRLLDVDAVEGLHIGGREVTGGLSRQPGNHGDGFYYF